MARGHQKFVAICLILFRDLCQLAPSLSRLRASAEYVVFLLFFERHLSVGLAVLAVEGGLADFWDQV